MQGHQNFIYVREEPEMPIRELSETELERLKLLSNEAIEVALVHLTATILRKRIIDATGPVRAFLSANKVHDFATQGRGAKAHGVKLSASYFESDTREPVTVSLYKPRAKPGKGGDPRIWIYGLSEMASAGDILAILNDGGQLAIINITRTDVASAVVAGPSSQLHQLLRRVGAAASKVADELLKKLRKLAASGPVKSIMSGKADTAIGRTLEHHLGISMNSRKDPDYKGIELKSARSRRGKHRPQLFCQVPNWKISKFKSSAQILSKFGVGSGADRRLNCTVRATGFNPRGLSFELGDDGALLHEVSSDKAIGRFATWEISRLQGRLAHKHNETFWITAKSTIVGGDEYFEFESVIHTRKPMLTEIASLIEAGAITMDHLISMKDGRANEGGPSFKISPTAFEVLFPPNKKYELI